MIDEYLSVTDNYVQPAQQTRIGIVGSVLVGGVFQRGDVTALAITLNHTSIGKSIAGKFLHSRQLEIGCHPHFSERRDCPDYSRENATKTFILSVPWSRFFYYRATEVRIIKFDDTV